MSREYELKMIAMIAIVAFFPDSEWHK